MTTVARVARLALVLAPIRAFAAEPLPSPSPSPAPRNEVTLGVSGVAGDRTNPEFLEYRDLPRGFTVPSFRFAGRAGRFDYDLAGTDAGQDDQRYRGRLATDRVALTGHLDDLPHRLGEGRTPFGDGGAGRFTLPVALRSDVQAAVDRAAAEGTLDTALPALAGDILAGGRPLDVGSVRRTAGAALSIEPAGGLSLQATFERQRRDGAKVSGLGFGLMNAAEIAEPVDETTDDATSPPSSSAPGAWCGRASATARIETRPTVSSSTIPCAPPTPPRPARTSGRRRRRRPGRGWRRSRPRRTTTP
jgi:hypothetical protein